MRHYAAMALSQSSFLSIRLTSLFMPILWVGFLKRLLKDISGSQPRGAIHGHQISYPNFCHHAVPDRGIDQFYRWRPARNKLHRWYVRASYLCHMGQPLYEAGIVHNGLTANGGFPITVLFRNGYWKTARSPKQSLLGSFVKSATCWPINRALGHTS